MNSLAACRSIYCWRFLANSAKNVGKLVSWQVLLENFQHDRDLLVSDVDLLFELLNVLALMQARAVGRDHVLQALDLLLVRGALDLLLDFLDLFDCLRVVFAEFGLGRSWSEALGEGIWADVVTGYRVDKRKFVTGFFRCLLGVCLDGALVLAARVGIVGLLLLGRLLGHLWVDQLDLDSGFLDYWFHLLF